jgi:hypothetical protein
MDKGKRVVEIHKTHEKDDDFHAVAIFELPGEVKSAVQQLERSGIELKDCSVIGRENLTGEFVVGYFSTGERMCYWGKMQAFWGGMWNILEESAFFMIPGIGPVLVGGPFVAALVRALKASMIVEGLTALGAGFYNIGFPKHAISDFEVAIREERIVVLVHGNFVAVAKAKSILEAPLQEEMGASPLD